MPIKGFLKSGTEIPAELIKPLTQLREDSGLPIPSIELKIAEALSRLPALPFEKKIVAMMQGRIEEALPKMPFE